MTLHAQSTGTVQARVKFVIGALGGVATATGHHLPGTWIENPFPDGMAEGHMVTVTITAYSIDWPTHHRRVVGAMSGMAITTTLGALMAEGGFLMTDKCRLMACPADMTLLAFEQALVITGMRRVTSDTAIGAITHQMVVG